MTQLTDARRAAERRVTFEEYLDWLDEGRHGEWVDGQIEVMSPASSEHQLLLTFLVRILGTFIEEHGLGVLLPAPFVMRLAVPPRGREPDILFVATQNLGRLGPVFVDGPVDLAIEVVSPDSVRRDLRTKLAEYEQAGVREYWVVDPRRKRAEFYVLGDEGRYRSVPPGQDGRYHSQVLEGLWIEVEWLWQDPKPTLNDIQREWGLI